MFEKPEQLDSKSKLISTAEQLQILKEFNNTDAAFPASQTIIDSFELNAEESPDKIAAVFGKEQVTYAKLNLKSNQMAHYLRTAGVGKETIVGIITERSLEMIIGILAILKAGGAYLPIDPDYPTDRIRNILDNCKCKDVLVQNHYMKEIDLQNKQVFDLNGSFDRESTDNPCKVNDSRNLAYIIYTSGSTGQPKGVMIEHISVINRLTWMQKQYPLSINDGILQKTPLTFDVSVWELFWWMLCGGQMIIHVPQGEKKPKEIIEAIEKYNVATLHFVPSMLSLFLDYVQMHRECGRLMKSLKYVFCSGEALDARNARRFYELIDNPNVRMINLYGPTETTVDVSYYECVRNKIPAIIPIGKPISNTRIYILNDNRQQQPIGATGELYISGIGVARGYINDEKSTNNKITCDPFYKGYKMYRSGDLGCWLPDGNIRYLGRVDNQIKINGKRIELGEIEFAVKEYPEISNAVVLYHKRDQYDGKLIAYFTADDSISTLALRKYLRKRLPEYMVPAQYIQVESLPLTASGKLDKIKLMRQTLAKNDKPLKCFAPMDEIDKRIHDVWANVLQTRIERNDSFYENGGTSLLALSASIELEKIYGVSPNLEDFVNQSLAQFSTAFRKRINKMGKQ